MELNVQPIEIDSPSEVREVARLDELFSIFSNFQRPLNLSASESSTKFTKILKFDLIYLRMEFDYLLCFE